MTKRGPDAGKRGLLERLLFSFMGPPQLGDPNAPVRAADRLAAPCPKCGRPFDEHEIVRTSKFTYTRCPDTGPGEAS
jgi:hypothetical protein